VKIVVVAPFFRPYENPRANRWSAVVDVWRRDGHEVQVVTSRGFGQILPEKSLHRVGFNSLKEIFQAIFPGKINRGLPNNSSKTGFVYKLFNWVNNQFWRPFYWPDEALIWIRPARQKLMQLLDNQSIDLLITVGLPFSAHLIGLVAKQKYPNLFWLVDVGDPLNFQLFPLNNPRFFSKKNLCFEGEILNKADQISVTNAGLATIYATCFGISQTKIKVIPPIFSGDLTPILLKRPRKVAGQKYKIGYFGSFFQKIREPKILLDFLKKLSEHQRNKIEIHFFGDIFLEFLDEIDGEPLIKRHGLLSRKSAAEAMHEMDFLLNFGNATAFQLPSKAVDYRLSGLPILNFCTLEADTFAEFMMDYPLIIHALESNSDFSESIFSFLEINFGKRVSPETLKKWSNNFSPETIGRAYLSGILK
jgi:hypothetical protein